MIRGCAGVLCLGLALLTGCATASEEDDVDKLPIVYTSRYNITLLGFQKLHPFDTEKYGRVHKHLVKQVGIDKRRFHEPTEATTNDLLTVHTQAYLDTLKQSKVAAQIAEVGMLASLPNVLVQGRLLKPMRLATGGTLLACELALKEGWAINLSGGYHHAKAESGSGFCFYADIPIALHRAWKTQPDLQVLLIDLDAHQGNGLEAILGGDPRVRILDIYNSEIYPLDKEVQPCIDIHGPLEGGVTDEEYLATVKEGLDVAFKGAKPGLIVYNAGTDIFAEDPLGGLKISEQGIIQRDELVFRAARTNGVPIAMVLSGGYTPRSAGIIGRSIENLLTQVLQAVESPASGTGK